MMVAEIVIIPRVGIRWFEPLNAALPCFLLLVSQRVAVHPGELVWGCRRNAQVVVIPGVRVCSFLDLYTVRVWYSTVHVETYSWVGLVASPTEEVIFPGVAGRFGQLPNSVAMVSSGDPSVAPLEIIRPGWE
jgi:hypothetical protein